MKRDDEGMVHMLENVPLSFGVLDLIALEATGTAKGQELLIQQDAASFRMQGHA